MAFKTRNNYRTLLRAFMIICLATSFAPFFSLNAQIHRQALIADRLELERRIDARVQQLFERFLAADVFAIHTAITLNREKAENYRDNPDNEGLSLSTAPLNGLELWLSQTERLPLSSIFAMIDKVDIHVTFANSVHPKQRKEVVNSLNRAFSQTPLSVAVNSVDFVRPPQRNRQRATTIRIEKPVADPGIEALHTQLKTLETQLLSKLAQRKPIATPTLSTGVQTNWPLAAFIVGLFMLLITYHYNQLKMIPDGSLSQMIPPTTNTVAAPKKSEKSEKSEKEEKNAAKVTKLTRNDRQFLNSFVAALKQKPNRYALSRCIDSVLEDENGPQLILNMLKVLGNDRSAIIDNLGEKTAERVARRTMLAAISTDFDYNVTILAIHALANHYDLESRRSENLGNDDDLIAITSLDDTVLLTSLVVVSAKEAAIVLSLFPAGKCREILAQLPTANRKEIYSGFSHIRSFTSKDVKNAIQSMKNHIPQQETSVIDGTNYILGMLGNMGQKEASTFLEAIDQNATLSAAVRRQYAKPNDLLLLESDDIRLVFTDISARTIAYFLYPLDARVIKLVLAMIRDRRQRHVSELLQELWSKRSDHRRTQSRATEARDIVMGQMQKLLRMRRIFFASEELRDDTFFSRLKSITGRPNHFNNGAPSKTIADEIDAPESSLDATNDTQKGHFGGLDEFGDIIDDDNYDAAYEQATDSTLEDPFADQQQSNSKYAPPALFVANYDQEDLTSTQAFDSQSIVDRGEANIPDDIPMFNDESGAPEIPAFSHDPALNDDPFAATTGTDEFATEDSFSDHDEHARSFTVADDPANEIDDNAVPFPDMQASSPTLDPTHDDDADGFADSNATADHFEADSEDNSDSMFGANNDDSDAFADSTEATDAFDTETDDSSDGMFDASDDDAGAFADNTDATDAFADNTEATDAFDTETDDSSDGMFGASDDDAGAFAENTDATDAFADSTEATDAFADSTEATDAFADSTEATDAFDTETDDSSDGMFGASDDAGAFAENTDATDEFNTETDDSSDGMFGASDDDADAFADNTEATDAFDTEINDNSDAMFAANDEDASAFEDNTNAADPFDTEASNDSDAMFGANDDDAGAFAENTDATDTFAAETDDNADGMFAANDDDTVMIEDSGDSNTMFDTNSNTDITEDSDDSDDMFGTHTDEPDASMETGDPFTTANNEQTTSSDFEAEETKESEPSANALEDMFM